MAYKRNRTRRTSPPRQYRKSSYAIRPATLIPQPVNMRQSYDNKRANVPAQLLTFLVSGCNTGRSQNSFRSDLSTHPSTYCPNHASGSSSGPTSKLGSARGVSFGTPSTSNGSNNGDTSDLVDEALPCEHRSPHDPEGTLQGINSSNRKSDPDDGGRSTP
jgi:hypothetical protein